MNNVVIVKTSDNMNDCVDLTDMGKEFVSQSFSSAGSFDQACNIHELDGGGSNFLRMIHFGKNIQPVIRNKNHSRIGFNGAERIVFRLSSCVCNCIEQCAFPDIRQTDNSEFHIPGYSLLIGIFIGFPAKNYIR